MQESGRAARDQKQDLKNRGPENQKMNPELTIHGKVHILGGFSGPFDDRLQDKTGYGLNTTEDAGGRAETDRRQAGLRFGGRS